MKAIRIRRDGQNALLADDPSGAERPVRHGRSQ
jgi:hypothetical protein